MIKKMQHRFILAAMSALGAVMIVLLIGINGINYYQTTASEDMAINRLMQFEKDPKRPNESGIPRMNDIPGMGSEAEHTTRFFVVRALENGDYEVLSKEFISAVDEETAIIYSQDVIAAGKKKGYYDDFRYHISDDTIIFMNVSSNIHQMKTLLIVSVVTALVSMLIVFILTVIFSRYAIRPFARNIVIQKQFITDASHELKTPITSISTSADILAMEYENDEWVSNIQRQSVRMSKLVGDMVTLSRLDEDVPRIEKEKFSLTDAAWELDDSFKLQYEAAGLTYTAEIEDAVYMFGSKDSIQKLISILLENALKYTADGGRIELRIYSKKKKAVIEVFNTCDEYDTSKLNRIFDRFYRMEESHATKTGGTGIGLSIAKAIVENHDGTIKATGEDGKSILFHIEL